MLCHDSAPCTHVAFFLHACDSLIKLSGTASLAPIAKAKGSSVFRDWC